MTHPRWIGVTGLLVLLVAQSCSKTPPAAPMQSAADQAASTTSSPDTEHAADHEGAPGIEYHNPLTPEQIAEGWISLFDGFTLFGWESSNEEVNWHVADGCITSDNGPIGIIHTTVPFADYELKCDFRYEPGANSGVFLRSVHNPTNAQTHTYELNLADEHPTGHTTGSYVDLKQTNEPIVASGDWHTFHVTLEGDHSIVRLDGEVVLDFMDEQPDRPTSGFVGLQHNQGKVEFKNILLKPLGMTDLFNGEDLTGWRVVPGSQAEFTVEDDTIHVTAAKQGFLETEGTYGDFVFQAEAICHRDPTEGEPLNSGYFFRAKPGTEEAPSHGYEVQIHNGWEGDDRTQPSNCGTGGIFRRIDARRVIPSDNEWFNTTLVASGPQIAVWVNGYWVTDWEDTREPNDNPREGLRLEPGHISLQGHDPTTDLSFRNLRVAEIPEH